MNFLLTGATSDIAVSFIEDLSQNLEGKILAVSRTKSEQELELQNVKFISGFDLTKESDLEKLSIEIEKYFDDTFTLIHSVGDFWNHKPIQSTEFGEAVSMINSHYVSLYGVIKTLIPIYKSLGGGRIIAFSCSSVGYNYPEMAAFTSAKAAIEGLIKCTANENSKFGIIANAIALSTIRTKKVEDSKIKKYHEGYITVDELIKIIKDLSNASPLINGNVIKLIKHSDYFYNEGYFQRNPSEYQ